MTIAAAAALRWAAGTVRGRESAPRRHDQRTRCPWGRKPSLRLHGFGTINADIDFDGDSELVRRRRHADTLNGDILDARLLGTFDANAILDVTNPWNTGVVTQVVLQGGELRGATITNDNLIRAAAGETLVTARVINDLQIFADGGDLEFETAGNDNDWDGTTNDGQLNAFDGDITLHDNADFEYAGTIFIGSGSELFTTGFSFEMQPGSLVDMTGGTCAEVGESNHGNWRRSGRQCPAGVRRSKPAAPPPPFNSSRQPTLRSTAICGWIVASRASKPARLSLARVG